MLKALALWVYYNLLAYNKIIILIVNFTYLIVLLWKHSHNFDESTFLLKKTFWKWWGWQPKSQVFTKSHYILSLFYYLQELRNSFFYHILWHGISIKRYPLHIMWPNSSQILNLKLVMTYFWINYQHILGNVRI